MEEEKKEIEEKTGIELEVNTTSEKPQKKKTWIIVFVIVLLCCLGCLGYFFKDDIIRFFDNKKESNVNYELKAEYKMLDNNLSDFDLYFLKLENTGNKNVIYSPLSIKYALEMLSEGAEGESKTQIDTILGGYKAGKYSNSKNMSLANALFVRDSYKNNVKTTYIETLQSKYNAEVKFDSFANANNINNWVNNKTLKLINNLIDDDDVKKNDYFLVNALAIDMDWTNCFMDPSNIYAESTCAKWSELWEYNALNEKFFTRLYGLYEGYPKLEFEGLDEEITGVEFEAVANKYDILEKLGESKIIETLKNEYSKWLKEHPDMPEVRVDFSKGEKSCETLDDECINLYISELEKNYGSIADSTDFYFYDNDDIKVFAKDLKTYNGTTLEYVGIMPKTQTLDKYIEDVTADKLNSLIKSLKSIELSSFEEGYLTWVYGTIPLFKYDYDTSLMDDLMKLGITDVFSKEKSNLPNLGQGSYITTAKHKANIEFTNEGIKAAAATAFGGIGDAAGGFKYEFEIPIKKIDLTFNKPYMYIIRNKATGEVWFAGCVYQPDYTAPMKEYMEEY